MWKGKSVWVVMPAYNEAKGIYDTVRGFISIPEVDQVIVVDNNSTDETAKLAKKAGASVVQEKQQGYGYACVRALRESKADYTVLVESDYSFFANDIYKFFGFIEDFDMVKGGRSNGDLIRKSADWTPFLRYGNWFLAKLIQVLYNGPSMREAGGTYRMINRCCLEKILPYISRYDSTFLPEMTTITLRLGIKTLEIPVNYGKRKGVSKITGDRWKAFKLGLSMMKVILWNRIKPLKKVKMTSSVD